MVFGFRTVSEWSLPVTIANGVDLAKKFAGNLLLKDNPEDWDDSKGVFIWRKNIPAKRGSQLRILTGKKAPSNKTPPLIKSTNMGI